MQAALLEGKQVGLSINANVVHFGPLPEPVIERSTPDEDFRELADRIQNTVFYFEPNEARLSESELLKIPELLNNIAELERIADEGGYTDLQVTLLGFADGSGSVIRNQAVSQQRAEAIRTILGANSVSSDLIVAWGVGSIDQSEITERVQRRVTIQVLYSMPSRDIKNEVEVDTNIKTGGPS